MGYYSNHLVAPPISISITFRKRFGQFLNYCVSLQRKLWVTPNVGRPSGTHFGLVAKNQHFLNCANSPLHWVFVESAHHVILQASNDLELYFSSFIAQVHLKQSFRNFYWTFLKSLFFKLCLALPMLCLMPCCNKMKIKFKVSLGSLKGFQFVKQYLWTKTTTISRLSNTPPTTKKSSNETSQVKSSYWKQNHFNALPPALLHDSRTGRIWPAVNCKFMQPDWLAFAKKKK